MAVNLSPVGGVAAQFFDNAGNVLTGGKLQTYLAGTTTPQPAYTTAAGNIPWSNPIILDAAGRVSGSGEIWLTDGIQYKFILRDSNDVLIATYDNINGINSNFVNFTNQQEIQTATAGQTVFNLTTTQYQPGTNSLSVFVDGVNQYGPGAQYAYVETDADTVTFINGLHVGALVKFTTSQLNSSGAVDASQVSYTFPCVNAVPTNVEVKLAQTVSVKDFGAVGDGVVDDTAAIQAAIDCVAVYGGAINFVAGVYNVSAPLILDSNISIIGQGTPTLKSTVAGSHIFSGVSLTTVSISGITFEGTGSITPPTISVGGAASSSTALVTFVGSTDVNISQCEFSDFYNGITVIDCLRIYIQNNYIHNWYIYGILGSGSDEFVFESNSIVGCDFTGADNSYGISATGNSGAGNLQRANSISFNVIADIPSWDGIMTHDCNGLRIIGNDIRNVRTGLDISAVALADIRNIIVSNNYIQATTIDTWAGAPALHGGIYFAAETSGTTYNIVCADNIIDGFFDLAGTPAFTNQPASISCTFANEIAITGNVISRSGNNTFSHAGIFIAGGHTTTTITGNNLTGYFNGGGIRYAGVTADCACITGNIVNMFTPTDYAIAITTSTITALSVADNALNAPLYEFLSAGNAFGTANINMGNLRLDTTFSVTSLANLAAVTLSPYAVQDVAAGDTITCASPYAGLIFTGAVTGVNQVTITVFNVSGSSQTISNGILNINATKLR